MAIRSLVSLLAFEKRVTRKLLNRLHASFIPPVWRASAVAVLATALSSQTTTDAPAIARKALDLLLAENYAELHAMFTPNMQAALTEQVLRQQVGPQVKALGAVSEIGQPSEQTVAGFQVVVIPVKFAAPGSAAAAIDFQASVDAEGKIGGMYLRPGGAPAAPAWSRPSYSDPGAFREERATVGEDEWKLPASLIIPRGDGPFPAVILVHGSGPHDMDETLGPNKPFRDLAEGLASRGVAVIRYEKRTQRYGSRMADIQDLTVQQETIEDALRAAALLRSRPDVDPGRVFVLGHSLGAYVAPRIARQDPRLAGLVLLAGNVRPMEDLIPGQMAALGVTDPAAVEKAKASLLGSLPASYKDDLKDYNPAAQAADLSAPMLILQGERDYQVTMTDFSLWKKALASRGNVALQSYPALNHLFIAGEGPSTPDEYSKPGHIAEEVIDDIAAWILKPAP